MTEARLSLEFLSRCMVCLAIFHHIPMFINVPGNISYGILIILHTQDLYGCRRAEGGLTWSLPCVGPATERAKSRFRSACSGSTSTSTSQGSCGGAPCLWNSSVEWVGYSWMMETERPWLQLNLVTVRWALSSPRPFSRGWFVDFTLLQHLHPFL